MSIKDDIRKFLIKRGYNLVTDRRSTKERWECTRSNVELQRYDFDLEKIVTYIGDVKVRYVFRAKTLIREVYSNKQWNKVRWGYYGQISINNENKIFWK